MINKITLLNKEFRLGIGFVNKLIDGTGKDWNSILKEFGTNAVVIIPQMMYYSLAFSYERKENELDFTIYDVYDWLDENDGVNGEFSVSFQNAFVQSITKDVPIDEDKKKVTKK
jgi:hypothetical protein